MSTHCGMCGANVANLNEDDRLEHFKTDYCLGYTRGHRMLGFLVFMTALAGAASITMTLFHCG